MDDAEAAGGAHDKRAGVDSCVLREEGGSGHRPVEEVDAAADHLPDPPERYHPGRAQPVEEECRQALRGGGGKT